LNERVKSLITIDLPQPRGPTTRIELLSPRRTVLDTRSCSWLLWQHTQQHHKAHFYHAMLH